MTKEELLQRKIEVDERLARLKVRDQRARAMAWRGHYMDRNEFDKLQSRIIELRSESQRLQMELGKLRSLRKQQRATA